MNKGRGRGFWLGGTVCFMTFGYDIGWLGEGRTVRGCVAVWSDSGSGRRTVLTRHESCWGAWSRRARSGGPGRGGKQTRMMGRREDWRRVGCIAARGSSGSASVCGVQRPKAQAIWILGPAKNGSPTTLKFLLAKAIANENIYPGISLNSFHLLERHSTRCSH